MKYSAILLLFALVTIFSCSLDDTTEKECLNKHNFYAESNYLRMGDDLNYEHIAIGFDSSYTDNEIHDFLNNTSLFSNEIFDILDFGRGYKVTLRKFRSPKSCVLINDVIRYIYYKENVLFASYTYDSYELQMSPPFHDPIPTITTYTNEIFVSLDNPINVEFIEKCLCPVLQSRHVVIMDNVAFHKVCGVKDAIESVGAKLIYLPPYSSDLNPIEQMWSKIKTCLRKETLK